VITLVTRRTFGFEIVCSKCQAPLRLIALIKTEVNTSLRTAYNFGRADQIEMDAS
jgi:hypothetical protein